MLNSSDSNSMIVFNEHPHVFVGQPSSQVFDVALEEPFTHEKYLKALSVILFKTGLSEVVPFIDYQCSKVREPFNWMNSFEKLIKDKAEDFAKTAKLLHRHNKWMTEIAVKRGEIKATAEHSRPRKPKKNINGFTDEKEYCFATVKEKLEEFGTLEEKISWLNDQVTEYRQNPPSYISTIAKPFDEQCELEIKNLEKREEMHQKSVIRSAIENGPNGLAEKIRISCNLNIFVDLFFQMMHSPLVDGKPILDVPNSLVALFISSCFLDKNGNPISFRSVQTMLEVNRPEKRPAEYKRLHIR